MTNNLELWNKVCKTNPNHTKKVTFGNKFTSVDAQYQIKMATEQLGVIGSTWGIKDISYHFIDSTDGQITALCQAVFFHPTGEFSISSSIQVVKYVNDKLKHDDDFAKKVETDLLTKALSKLGFNADVFLGLYDDNKYIQKMLEEFNKKEELTESHPRFEGVKKYIQQDKGNWQVVEKEFRVSQELKNKINNGK